MKKANLTSTTKMFSMLAIVLMSLGINNLSAQCALACNDLVQLSLDQTCSVTLTADMVLEGPAPAACGSSFQVQVKKNGVWTPTTGSYVATNADVNKTYEVRVRQTVSPFNTCWGNIHIEDKLPPALTCANITLTCAATNYTPQNLYTSYLIAQAFPNSIAASAASGNNPYTVAAGLLDNCSSVSLTYSDAFTDLPCGPTSAGNSAIVVRSWTAVDASGNVGTCNQTIFFQRRSIAQVQFPPVDVTVNCQASNAGNVLSGAPFVFDNGVRVPLTAGFCEMNVSSHDDTLVVCAGSFKIIRTWTVYDWCTPTSVGINPAYFTQVIKYIDDQAPVILSTDVCGATFEAGTNPNNCLGSYNLPDFVAQDVCTAGLQSAVAKWTIGGISQTLNGVISNTANAWSPEKNVTFGVANNLPLGATVVTYTLTDKCGNSSSCSITVNVTDNVPPVTICTEVTQVAVGYGDGVTCGSGNILVPAASFDQGSYDNCGPVYFKVRRMDSNSCGSFGQFRDAVQFCCSDVSATGSITVILRVYDIPTPAGDVSLDFGDGHYNDCMIQVLVEDKLKPTCVAPSNVTVSCEAFDPSFWAYGVATSYDNCCCVDEDATAAGVNPLALSPDVSNWDATCNRGTYVRRWRATDCHGNVGGICTQRIVVNYVQDYQIKWPDDKDVTTCNGATDFGAPTFTGKDCELTAVSYDDQVYTIVTDACRKIERTWTVINWCTYDANLGCVQVNNPSATTSGPTVRVAGPNAAGGANGVYLLPNAPALTGATLISATSNSCITYKQIIKINDQVAPVAEDPIATECDYSKNDEYLFNDITLWDGTHSSHDLCEGGEVISITANDDCSKADVNIRALLFMDLDNNGVMETVFNTNDLNPPARGFIWVNNANNVNFAGTTAVQFDKRPAPITTPQQRYSLGLQITDAAGKRTASLRFRTLNPDAWSNPQLPYGNYKIKWIISDGCGNETVKEKLFTIKDCKKPTVVCRNGLSVNLMNGAMTGVTLWASDFLQYAEDNCTPPITEPYSPINDPADQLVYGIVKTGTPEDNGTFPLNPNGTPRTSVNFTCADAANAAGTTVKLWAKDKAGNADFCQAFISVQDNMGVCPNPNGTTANVAGALKTEMVDGLQDGSVKVTGNSPLAASYTYTQTTNAAGVYTFSNVIPLGSNGVVAPLKNDNHLNGVTTYDLLLISKHILGVTPLSTPYKMIAADVNKSGSITTFDIVELRKLILGIYTELPANTSWRFVDKSFVFPNSSNPFTTAFPETRTISSIQSNLLEENFVAMKIGDVNDNATANNLQSSDDRTAATTYFDIADQTVVAGEEVTVNFKSAEKMAAFQFTMNLSGLKVAEIVGSNEIKADNFAVFADKITASVNGGSEFAVKFVATQAGQLSKMISVGSAITAAEAYTNEGTRNEVAFRFNGTNGSIVAGAGFELLQNTPNPVATTTTITFNLPEAASATLKISTTEGRVIKTLNGNFVKGINTVTLNRSDLETGILFYQLDTPTNSAVKKMIVVE
jgi:hypothetical protein